MSGLLVPGRRPPGRQQTDRAKLLSGPSKRKDLARVERQAQQTVVLPTAHSHDFLDAELTSDEAVVSVGAWSTWSAADTLIFTHIGRQVESIAWLTGSVVLDAGTADPPVEVRVAVEVSTDAGATWVRMREACVTLSGVGVPVPVAMQVGSGVLNPSSDIYWRATVMQVDGAVPGAVFECGSLTVHVLVLADEADAPLTFAGLMASHNPQGWWRLWDQSGSVALDQTGANPGTYTITGSTTYRTAGPLATPSYGVRFTGTDGPVIPKLSTPGGAWDGLDPVAGASIAFWVKRIQTGGPSGWVGIISSSAPGAGRLTASLRDIHNDFAFTWSGNTTWEPTGMNALSSWTFFVLVAEGGVMRLYRNGVLVAGSGTATGVLAAHAIGFGNPWNPGQTRFWHTTEWSDVATIPKALTADDVAALWAASQA